MPKQAALVNTNCICGLFSAQAQKTITCSHDIHYRWQPGRTHNRKVPGTKATGGDGSGTITRAPRFRPHNVAQPASPLAASAPPGLLFGIFPLTSRLKLIYRL